MGLLRTSEPRSRPRSVKVPPCQNSLPGGGFGRRVFPHSGASVILRPSRAAFQGSVGRVEEGGEAEPRRPKRTPPPGVWGVTQQVSEDLRGALECGDALPVTTMVADRA